MERRRWYLNPTELTTEERLERVSELLSKPSYLLAVEEMEGEEIGESTSAFSRVMLPAKSGPVPYGEKRFGLDGVTDENEMKWVARIEELAKSGLSTKKIARCLNEEDKMSRHAGKWRRVAVWRILRRRRVFYDR